MDNTNDNMEMKTFKSNGTDAATYVTADNGNGSTHTGSPDPPECSVLLDVQGSSQNGGSVNARRTRNGGHRDARPEKCAIRKVKDELNEVVFWKFRLWMVLIFIFLLIIAVILISLAVCPLIHEDMDEKFDVSTFDTMRSFNGSFRMPALVFTEELLVISSNESQALTTDLQGKLTDLYSSSPALGRYFSAVEISALRNGSVIAEYQLTFRMPVAQQDQLRKFTLSREMVYNVFRQFLYDQETDESAPTYIDPISLKLF